MHSRGVVMKEIKKSELLSYPEFSESIYWSQKNTLYKICKLLPIEHERIEFLKFIYKLNIPGLIKPLDLLSNEKIYGYEMPYVDGTTVDKVLVDSTSDINVIQIIKEMFNILGKIHEHFIYGDIRCSNIMISNNLPLFIDWDSGKPLNSNYWVVSYYNLFIKRRYGANKLEDIAKLYICALSLLYQIDIELFVMRYGPYALRVFLTESNVNSEIINALNILIRVYEEEKDSTNYDFIEMFSNVSVPSNKEKELIRARLNPFIRK